MEGLSWRPGRPGAWGEGEGEEGGGRRRERGGGGGGREECVSSRDGCSVSILHSFGLGFQDDLLECPFKGRGVLASDSGVTVEVC